MQALKLGFIGAGFVANFHAAALKMIRGIELSGGWKWTRLGSGRPLILG